MKTIRRAGIAAAVLAGVGIAIGVFVLVRDVVVTKDSTGKREWKLAASAAKEKLFTFPARDIKQIEVTVRSVDYSKDETPPAAAKTDKVLGLARVGEKWMLTKPLHALAATGEADGVATAIADLSIQGAYADVNQHDPQYGLDNPCVVARVTLRTGREVEIRIGKDTVIESNVYLAVSDDRRVYYASSSVKTSLIKEPQDLREKKVADFNQDAVKRLLVDQGGARVVCEQEGTKEAKEWWLTQPVRALADKYGVDGVVTALKDIEVREFVDGVKSLTPYGLDAPQATLRLDFGKGKDDVVVMFGKQVKKSVASSPSASTPSSGELKDLVYCMARGRDEVFLVDADVVGKVAKKAIDLRDRNIVDFDVTDVIQVAVVRKSGANFEVTKKEAKWTLTKPALGEATASKIENFLWDLKDIKAEDFLEGKEVSGAESGLEDPLTSVTLTFKKQDRPLAISFGRQETAGTRCYCKTSAMRTAVLIAGTALDSFPKTVDELKQTSTSTTTPATPSVTPPPSPPAKMP